MPNLAKQKKKDEQYLKNLENNNLSELLLADVHNVMPNERLVLQQPKRAYSHRENPQKGSSRREHFQRESVNKESFYRPHSIQRASVGHANLYSDHGVPRTSSFNLNYDKLVKDLASELKQKQDVENANANELDNRCRTRLKKAWISFLTSAWCYGLNKIFSVNRQIYKVMWTFFVTVSTLLCAMYIHRQISNYLMYYVITETHIVYTTSMIFPQITLCKDNKAVQNEFVIERCEFDRIDCRDKFDLITVFDDYGRRRECIRFNGGSNFTGHKIPRMYQTRETSIFNGLKLIVAHQTKELNLIYINDYERNSLYSADQLIKNKESVSIALDKALVYKLGEPYNQCIKKDKIHTVDGELVNKTLDFNTVYSREKCNQLCFFKLTALKFNCSFPGLYELTHNSTDCTTFLNKKLMGVEINRFNASVDCVKECPFQCDKSHYELKVSHDYDNSELTNTTFRLFVYYKELKYSKVTQIPKTQFPDLVAQMGGTLGLFIGFRILSFIEIFQFIVEMFIILSEKVKPKRPA